MNSVITNPISNIPVNEKSHVHGWTQIWRDQTGSAINHKCTPAIKSFDTVYIDHGANFGGTLNLFGGAAKEVFDRINLVASCPNIVSLDHDMPDYGEMLKKRIGANTTYEGITEEWCDMLSARLANIPSLKQHNLDTVYQNLEGITVGDSHTSAFSHRTDMVYRNDGKTLHGALKTGLRSLFRGESPFGRVTLCLGSIDIRHHILRHSDFVLENLIREYVAQGSALEMSYNCKVSYAAPVPVEFEGRRIPKSGFYKKEPFFGSQQERSDLTKRFIDELNTQSGNKVIMPPADWYTMNPELYAKTYMEHGSSFHIAPPFYRRNDWGVTGLGA
mgnify:CR=1 FL=1|jgi:hypothetical protein|tara:strand:+ start:1913 stop:2905 length:993 start_codon:yes stop_codon:yes gene_type:complete